MNGTSELPGHMLAIVGPKTITAPIVTKTVAIEGAVTRSVTAREPVAIQEMVSLVGKVVAPNVTLVVMRVLAAP